MRRRRKKEKRILTGKRLFAGVILSAALACLSISFPSHNMAHTSAPPEVVVAATSAAGGPFRATSNLATLDKTITDMSAERRLRSGVYAIEPETGKFVDIRGTESFSSASIIKVPVLIKLMQLVDAGDVTLDQMLTLSADEIGGGSGFLQWSKPGTQMSVREVAELMITVSDNTATNMLIDLCGGKEACNRSFLNWGLTQTKINEALPDLGGKNKLSPYDMVLLLGMVDQGTLLTPKSKEYALAVMERARTRTLLPAGLPGGCRIAHKTGDIGSLVGDVGIVTARNNKRYIVAEVCERPWNDPRANQMLREISSLVYSGITNDAAPNVVAQSSARQGSSSGGHHRRRRRH